ncbi:hypothetical protein PFLUV_G00126510 [Perca fluviatilis]|uniref:Uncharacterized protein n=1 Tax=Perca fluviatilis TaxID=8168 RepID=A0A6A5F484_PERFL|nr:hypothetical protein PFLUV_G00126510 [Perca fluviatilis]
MWTQDSALLLLLACCLWSAEAQSDGRQSIWDDPIKFKTKANDVCSMIITGQGEYTRLRLLCLSLGREQDLNLVLHPQGKPFESHHRRKQHREPIHNHRHLLSRAMLRGWLGSTAGGHFKASAPTSSVFFGNNEEDLQF